MNILEVIDCLKKGNKVRRRHLDWSEDSRVPYLKLKQKEDEPWETPSFYLLLDDDKENRSVGYELNEYIFSYNDIEADDWIIIEEVK